MTLRSYSPAHVLCLLTLVGSGCLGVDGLEQASSALDPGESPGRSTPGYCSAVTTVGGTVERRSTAVYDDAGRLIAEETDVGLDGSIDRRVVHVWGDASVLAGEVDAAQTIATVVRVHDAEGHVVRETVGGPGSPTDATVWTWVPGAATPSEARVDRGSDGTIDEIRSYVTEGPVVERLVAVADGTVLEVVERTTEDTPRGRRTTLRRSGPQGVTVESELIDVFGNLLVREEDRDDDGAFERVTTFDYTCFVQTPTPAPPPSPRPATVSFVERVEPILVAKCKMCHQSSSRTFRVSGNGAADLASAQAQVTPFDPGASALIQKATGHDHRGGTRVRPADPEYETLSTWIREGAR